VPTVIGAPPGFLRLVGHPVRWRLLGELTASDRTVHELTARVGRTQSLVSYHLGRLRAAGLVATRRSSADGRDAYYTVDLTRIGEELTATAATLHPGLVAAPPRSGIPGADRRDPVSVLFLCTGNSARSQMAEALAVHRSGGAVRASSAGSHPKPLRPEAVAAMQTDYGIDISGWSSKHLDEVADRHFDWVVTLCDRVREVCPELPGTPEAVHWSIPDPAAAPDAGDDAFRRTAAELDVRIGFWLAVATGTSAPTR